MQATVEQRVLPVYLIVDGEVIYEIAPNSVLNIGRLDTNDIVLDDYKVSREHAILKYTGTEFMLVDLASTHGTYVNGKAIDRAMVQFGDKIQIISHDLMLSREMPEDLGNGSEPVAAAKMARTLDRRLKFFGGLNEFALITLVQFLYQEKQSGLLLLELGQKPGPRIYFLNGDIIHVSQGENLAELLVRQNHEQSLFFYFHHETNFPERTITESTPNYLMSLCHSHDEQQVPDLAEAVAVRISRTQAVTSRIKPPPLAR
ncbi:MAG: FHA domain-containing protein [Methylacidiphilales bacterium]|nr:FHA domain-containing protein [Candidatus Methylacidiphilales bacterium]